jgi:DNA-binding NarL/FixJ family response regulator
MIKSFPLELNKIPLSERQIEILKLASYGLGIHDIAKQLNVTANTVSTHMVAIRSRLGIPDRTEGRSMRALLTRYYIEHFEVGQ